VTGLTIGINALYLIPGEVGGTEIYLRSLLCGLAEIDPVNRYVVFTNRATGPDVVPQRDNFLRLPQPCDGHSRPARLCWEQSGLVWAARQKHLDVLLNAGFTAPVLAPCPMVTVFHDLQHKRHPEYFGKFELPFWRLFLWAAAHRSSLLLADSQSTAQDLLRYYDLHERKVRVVELGVGRRFFAIGEQRRPESLEPYILCVSTLRAHKNLDRLIRAFARFLRTKPEFQLVIAGVRGSQTKEIERLITELGLKDFVKLAGWVPREELYSLYERAWAFVYPSSFEGFGIPVLEALAAGIPTACSAIEPLHTLAGKAALQFDPENQDAMADALLRLTSDEPLRERLTAAGPERAAQYSWRTTAQRTLEALQEAACYRSKSSS
jgi:glycosyltransferase involved in cell wall biosynthesis